jgi:simple sugar transport system substrate-binding protein
MPSTRASARLSKAGIVVIGFNNDDLEGADGNCRQAYVGMNEFASGYELGNA